MKMFYNFWALALCLICTMPVFGQRIVQIAASSDPTMPTDIFPIIMGDTAATGERVDNETIYKLENGQVYVTTDRLVNTKDWILHIEAEDLTDTNNKAIIARRPNTSGSFQDIGRPEGDVTFKNLWIIAGERGPLEQHDWGKFRISGSKTRIIVQDCIIEKDRGGFLQVRADSVKIYVDGSIFRNGGNRRILQGNGRGVDARNFTLDTLIMTNSIVHNLQDRFFRSQGAVAPHNYIKIDHCTAFNVAGRHGFIQLGSVHTAEITNNMFMNPIMMGSSPIYTDEQTQPDGDLHKVITLDTLVATTSLTIAGNNIFWTQDVLDYWASNDSVNAPGVLSSLVKTSLGADTANAYFSEVLDLENIPVSILPYVEDVYADPSATDMFDFIVEDSLLANTGSDSGNLFDFANFSVCYPGSSLSATASTTNGAIGVFAGCSNLTHIHSPGTSVLSAFHIAPNPVMGGYSTFNFELSKTGMVGLEIYDMQGRKMDVVQQGVMASGNQQLNWTVPAGLSKGMYIARLQANEAVNTLKFHIY